MPADRQTPSQLRLLEAVRAKMVADGMRQHVLAAIIKCSPANMSRILRGEIGLRPEFERRLESLISGDEALLASALEIVRGFGGEKLKATLQFLQVLQQLSNAKVDE